MMGMESRGSLIEPLKKLQQLHTEEDLSGTAELATRECQHHSICDACDAAVCRRAQRKFRERQKQKLADSEGKATELRKELEQLRVEKSKLETRNALLERLVTMKGSGAKSTVSDRDSAREETPRHASQGSQMVHLTVREGVGFFCLP